MRIKYTLLSVLSYILKLYWHMHFIYFDAARDSPLRGGGGGGQHGPPQQEDDPRVLAGLSKPAHVPSRSFQMLQQSVGGSEVDTSSLRPNVAGGERSPCTMLFFFYLFLKKFFFSCSLFLFICSQFTFLLATGSSERMRVIMQLCVYKVDYCSTLNLYCNLNFMILTSCVLPHFDFTVLGADLR